MSPKKALLLTSATLALLILIVINVLASTNFSRLQSDLQEAQADETQEVTEKTSTPAFTPVPPTNDPPTNPPSDTPTHTPTATFTPLPTYPPEPSGCALIPENTLTEKINVRQENSINSEPIGTLSFAWYDIVSGHDPIPDSQGKDYQWYQIQAKSLDNFTGTGWVAAPPRVRIKLSQACKADITLIPSPIPSGTLCPPLVLTQARNLTGYVYERFAGNCAALETVVAESNNEDSVQKDVPNLNKLLNQCPMLMVALINEIMQMDSDQRAELNERLGDENPCDTLTPTPIICSTATLPPNATQVPFPCVTVTPTPILCATLPSSSDTDPTLMPPLCICPTVTSTSTIVTITPASCVTITPSNTPTLTLTPRVTLTSSPVPVGFQTPATYTPTPSPTPTDTPTRTPTPTLTPSPTFPAVLEKALGSFIAVDQSGQTQVFLADKSTIRPIQLDASGEITYAALNPQGEVLVYLVKIPDGTILLAKRTLSSEEESTLASSKSNLPITLDYPVSWSPEGDKLIVTLLDSGVPQLYFLDVNGGEPSLIYDQDKVSFDQAWGGVYSIKRDEPGNPDDDGEFIAFVGYEEGQERVYVTYRDAINPEVYLPVSNPEAPHCPKMIDLAFNPDVENLLLFICKGGTDDGLYLYRGENQVRKLDFGISEVRHPWAIPGDFVTFESNGIIYLGQFDESGALDGTLTVLIDKKAEGLNVKTLIWANFGEYVDANQGISSP